ncbi:ubiquinone biosynthesis protein COQ4 homolog, mitochondrial-like [Diachasmimorpha longicaudata]|uniref:ubiquinone biosynthesis protein COQ4 homolog, mitochondrial-like n=1 Tax=Diachasmimorpha longicaudata TaxID=58733 RepID=UPI0030B8887B
MQNDNVWWLQVGSALFYGLSSVLITFVNKTVLTSYDFPSFQVLGIGQMLATIVVLSLAKQLRYVDFPNLDRSTGSKIFPLPLIYIVVGVLLGRRLNSTYGGEAFVDDFTRNHVRLTNFQRAILACGSAAVSLVDPYRADMIACLGETTGKFALLHCYDKMKSTDEGMRILHEKPRINTNTIDMKWLEELPEGTLGKTYHNFLKVNNVTPDSRDHVKFVNEIELAYVMQRYREVHDIFHAVLLMPTTMLGEVTVKWVEALQTRLPMCIGGAVFGAVRLRPRQRQLYAKYHLPWAINTGKSAEFLLSIYFEERWEQRLDDFHREMNIQPLAQIVHK